MKNILVPTDFSPESQKASECVLQLFNSNQTIHLLNAYEQPKMGKSLFINIVQFLKEDSLNNLKEEKKRLSNHQYYKGQDIQHISDEGSLINIIIAEILKKKIDVIVVGIKKRKCLERIIKDSNAPVILKKCNLPIILIPENYNYKELNKILILANLNKTNIVEKLNPVIYLSKLHFSEIIIIHVGKDILLAKNKETINSELKDIKHSIENIENIKILKLIEYVNNNDIDLICLNHLQINILYKLLFYNIFMHIAFKTKKLVLVLNKN
ncbi:MAG: universal stress protein [Bacteroidales bacterium]|nr:universal stress protein [Bacteroidales bacterium]